MGFPTIRKQAKEIGGKKFLQQNYTYSAYVA